ncbi:DNA ligase-1 [Paenibacillus sp. UNC496MF]|uniref:ATP-dependent DNA ligase n=1 Tax=Paenibacillus sp. UNC496MF TaxID=1502753 RepID=UPI0008E3A43F|nr:RNA ligase family protein [Paenibacillus sp. UNC496MF]SFJ55953.1 DNA ligase-1 [Paenibacillus sp. UNC496MF]
MFISPMLLQKVEEPFDSSDWFFEPKMDGHRLIVSFINGHVKMYTRHNNEVTRQYPELFNVPVPDGVDVVLDGEVAVVNDDGTNDFEGVIQRLKITKAMKIRDAFKTMPVQLFVFDILFLNGKSLMHLPLAERKEILHKILTPNQYYKLTMFIEGKGKALFELIQQKNLEGIVCKKKNSRYVSRRSDTWLKVINYSYAIVSICAYSRRQFGWLAEHNGKPVGVIELAIPADVRKSFYKVAQQLINGQDKHYVYVKPLIKVQVRFRNWTSNGMLRSPEFVKFIV